MSPPGRVLGVRTGPAALVDLGGRRVRTASVKNERRTRVRVTRLGLEGDEQGDLRVHGGPDKAVCVYPVEHYSTWEREHGRSFPVGAFGENLVTSGLLEGDLHVGDRLRVGDALTQVVAPRRPCWKLGARWADRDLPQLVQESGLTGYYLRVLEEGAVQRLDPMTVVARESTSVTVAELNRVMNVDPSDLAAARHVLTTTGLPASWRRTLLRRLAGEVDDAAATRARLLGERNRDADAPRAHDEGQP